MRWEALLLIIGLATQLVVAAYTWTNPEWVRRTFAEWRPTFRRVMFTVVRLVASAWLILRLGAWS